MKQTHVYIAALFATATIVGQGNPCRADYGPSAVVFEMIAEQHEQDVIVTMGAVYSAGGGRVVRTDESTGEEVEIIPNNPGLPVVDEQPSEYCAAYFDVGGLTTDQSMYCDPNPEACVDCDGDGVGECVEKCETAKYFEATDACVPPGVYTYTTAYASQIMEDVVNAGVQIEVFDNDYAACSGEEEPPEEDTEETEDSDSETVIVEDDTEVPDDTDSDVDTLIVEDDSEEYSDTDSDVDTLIVEDDSEEYSDTDSDVDTLIVEDDSEEYSDTDSDVDTLIVEDDSEDPADTYTDSDSDTTDAPYDEDVDSDTTAVTADPEADISTETIADSPSTDEGDTGSTLDGTAADEDAPAQASGCSIVSVGIFPNAPQGIVSILSALL